MHANHVNKTSKHTKSCEIKIVFSCTQTKPLSVLNKSSILINRTKIEAQLLEFVDVSVYALV